MVSLENRVSYLEGIKESPKLKAFYHFLFREEIAPLFKNKIDGNDEQFLKLISAIQTNNKAEFEEIYNLISKKSNSRLSSSFYSR